MDLEEDEKMIVLATDLGMEGTHTSASIAKKNCTADDLRKMLMSLDSFSASASEALRKQKVAILYDLDNKEVLKYGPEALVEYKHLTEEETEKRRLAYFHQWKSSLLNKTKKCNEVRALYYSNVEHAPVMDAYELTALLYTEILKNGCKAVASSAQYADINMDTLHPTDVLKVYAVPAIYQKNPHVFKRLREVFFKHNITRSFADSRLRFVYEPHAAIYISVNEMSSYLKPGATIIVNDGGCSTFDISPVTVKSTNPLVLEEEIGELTGLEFGMSKIDDALKKFCETLTDGNRYEDDDNNLWFLEIREKFIAFKERSLKNKLEDDQKNFDIDFSFFEVADEEELAKRINDLEDEGCFVATVGRKKRKKKKLRMTSKFVYDNFYKDTMDNIYKMMEKVLTNQKYDFVLYAGAAFNFFDLRNKIEELACKHLRFVYAIIDCIFLSIFSILYIRNKHSPDYEFNGKMFSIQSRILKPSNQLSPVVEGALLDGILTGKNKVLEKKLSYSFTSGGIEPKGEVPYRTIDKFAKDHNVVLTEEKKQNKTLYSNFMYCLVNKGENLKIGNKETLHRLKNKTHVFQYYYCHPGPMPYCGLPLELMTEITDEMKQQPDTDLSKFFILYISVFHRFHYSHKLQNTGKRALGTAQKVYSNGVQMQAVRFKFHDDTVRKNFLVFCVFKI